MKEGALLDERFEVLRSLGRRKAVVRDREDPDASVLLRLLEPEEDPYDVELRREVGQTLAVQHPAIARIRAVDRLSDGRSYYTQDFVEGESLYQWALTRDVHEILELFAQLLEILGAYHALGLVVGGSRPLQLKVEETLEGARLRLVDQGGLLREYTRSDVSASGFHGLAPERRVGARIDRRANLYEAGLILYELLAGSSSDELPTGLPQTAGSTPPPLTQLAPGLPLDLATFVMVLLRRYPDDRPPDVRQALLSLESLSGMRFGNGTYPPSLLPLPAPFVGRGSELERVLSWCEGVMEPKTKRWSKRSVRAPKASMSGSPTLVVIGGEAGSGRRRLLDEVALRLGNDDVLLVRGRCDAGGQGPFGPFGQILRELSARPRILRALHGAPENSRWALRALLPDRAADLPAGFTPSPLEAAGAEALRRLDAIALHFMEVARAQPLAILIEDFDRARTLTRALALHIARRAHAAGPALPGRLIILVGWQGPFDDDLEGSAIRTLALDPLTSQDLEFLATATLGEEGCTPELRAFIEAHAQGSPALTLSIVRAHLAEGLVPDPPGADRTRLVDAQVERVMRAPAMAQRALLCLGMLKRPADVDLLARVCGCVASELRSELEPLCLEGVLERHPEWRYTLRHPELGQRLQGKLHQDASELLRLLPEALADDLDANLGSKSASTPITRSLEVAELAALGGVTGPLNTFAKLAATYLESLGAFTRAANLWAALLRASGGCADLRDREVEARLRGHDPQRAEELIRELLDISGERSPDGMAMLYSRLTRSLLAQDREAEARKALSRAMTYLSDQGQAYPVERARLADRAAQLHLAAGELEDAEAKIKDGLEAIKAQPKAEGAGQVRARLLGHDGQLALLSGDYERAIQLLKASLASQEREDLRAESALSLQRLGQAAFAAGQLEGADTHWRAALERYEALQDLVGVARIHSSLGLLATRQGSLTEGREHLETSLELRRLFGDRRATAASLHNLGYVYASAGALEEAKAAYRECLELRLADGDRYYAASASNNLGEVLTQLGRTHEAEELLLDARSVRAELGDRRGEAESLANLAELDLLRGNYARCLQREARSEQLREELGDEDDSVDALRRRSRCMMVLGKLDEARSLAERSLTLVEDHKLSLLEGPCRLQLGQVQVRRGRRGAARRELERARRAADQLGDRLTARSATISLAGLRLASGRDPSDARALLDSRPVPRPGRLLPLEGRQPVDRHGALRVRERLLRARIELSLEAGSAITAARCAEEALQEARRTEFPEFEWRALQVMAAAAEVRHAHDLALSLAVEAQERVEQLLTRVPEEHRESYLAADPLRAAALKGDSPVKVLGVKASAPGDELTPLVDPGTENLLLAMVESSVPTIQPAKFRQATPPSRAQIAQPLDLGFQTLRRLNRLIVDEPDIAKVQEAIVRAAAELCHGERAFLAVFGKTHDDVLVLATANMDDDVESPRQRFFRHCAFKAATGDKLVLSAEARVSPETKQQSHVVGLGLRSVLAAPVVSPDGRRGALYVDHTFQVGRFTDREVDLIDALADQCAMSIGRGALEGALLQKQGISPGVPQRQFLVARATLETPAPVRVGDPSRGLIGRSKALRAAAATLVQVGATEVSVLIEGPGGVGKGVAARAVHEASSRKKLIVCDLRDLPTGQVEVELFGHEAGAFPGAGGQRTGLFMRASKGTLLLEHIDEAPLEIQAKLVRALEQRAVQPLGADEAVPFDVRIVATCKPDVEARVREGRLREDLFLLVAQARVVLVGLDERPEDKEPLIDLYLSTWSRSGDPPTLTPEARAALVARRFPGNGRELNAVLAAAASLAEDRPIEVDDLLPERRIPTPLREALKDFERQYIQSALLASRGDLTQTAKALGISRRALKRKIEQLGIEL